MSCHVLIVDDEPTIRRLISRILRDAGCEVTLAAHPAEAMAAFFDQPPDVLVTDFDMPQMTGPELVEAIGARVGSSMPPCILVSGALDLVLPSQQHLFAAVVPKPFRVPELVQAVRRLRPRARRRTSGTQLRAVVDEPSGWDDSGESQTG